MPVLLKGSIGNGIDFIILDLTQGDYLLVHLVVLGTFLWSQLV